MSHHNPDQGIEPMIIALRMYCFLRILPITLFPFRRSSRGQQSLHPILIGRKDLQSDWPRLRMFVLCRDRSRCRGCDRNGDEVTLCIHLIRHDASGRDAALTLCVKCSDLAIEKNVKGDTIPEFLRLLWRNIYHPEHTSGLLYHKHDNTLCAYGGPDPMGSTSAQAI